jgi:hypothetical protein
VGVALPEPDEGVQAPEVVGEHAGPGLRFLALGRFLQLLGGGDYNQLTIWGGAIRGGGGGPFFSFSLFLWLAC